MLIQPRTEYSEASSSDTQPRSSLHQAPDTLRKSDQESQLYIAIRGLQVDLRRRQLADHNLSRSHMLRFCAPLAIFIYFFAVGIIIPRNPSAKAKAAMLMETFGSFGIVVVLSALAVGAVLVLVILWALIWPLAKILQSFCEWDLTPPNSSMPDQPGEYEFTQANMLFGGLFT